MGRAKTWKRFKKELCKYPELTKPDSDSSECKASRQGAPRKLRYQKGD